MRCIVKKPLSIPRRLVGLPVDPALRALPGFDRDTSQDELPLVPIRLASTRFAGCWHVNALDSVEGKEPEVLGSMACNPGTRRDQVLTVAEDWVRASVKHVSGCVYELPPQNQAVAEHEVQGAILAC